MDTQRLSTFVDEVWDDSIVAELVEYIKIPNKSPAFDPQWDEHGYMEAAVKHMERWAREQDIVDASLEVVRLDGRTPLIFMEIPGDCDDRVVLYGHLDKQPEMTGWRDDLGPFKPVIEGDRLYGRGGADDGYAIYASLTAIRALREQGLEHARCVVIIEACEESGSYDLPHYIDALAERIGEPSFVVCLDSGCGNYDQLWCTTSLRGSIGGTLHVQVLSEGVHSGDASGIVPSSFRVLRRLLGRLEDDETGTLDDAAFYAQIPVERRRQAAQAAEVLGDTVFSKFPLAGDTSPITSDLTELVLNRTWRPALAVTGADGLPAIRDAGNVMRPGTAVRLSVRLPPTCDAPGAMQRLGELLEADPPYGATVTFEPEEAAPGWNAPALSPWLEASAQGASTAFFGRDCVYMGEGGTIPFMGMLGEKFPAAQFLILGVLGPHSNAHGPNEFLHIPTGKKVTACVAKVVHDHYLQSVTRDA